jgi:RNA polymerase sigma factor (sigma-70 family)
MTSKVSPILEQLYADAARYPLLSPEREAELSRIILAGAHPEAVKTARQELAASNIRLVVHWAKRIGKNRRGFALDELVSAGFLGLHRACSDFDATRSTFATYASYWIRSAIIYDCEGPNTHRAVRVPHYLSELRSKLARQGLAEAGCTAEVQGKLRELGDRTLTDDSHLTTAQTIEDADLVRCLLNAVKPRDRRAVKLYYGLGPISGRAGVETTLEHVGQKLGVGKERARQIIARGLRVMRRRAKELGCI